MAFTFLLLHRSQDGARLRVDKFHSSLGLAVDQATLTMAGMNIAKLSTEACQLNFYMLNQLNRVQLLAREIVNKVDGFVCFDHESLRTALDSSVLCSQPKVVYSYGFDHDFADVVRLTPAARDSMQRDLLAGLQLTSGGPGRYSRGEQVTMFSSKAASTADLQPAVLKRRPVKL